MKQNYVRKKKNLLTSDVIKTILQIIFNKLYYKHDLY